MADDREPPPFGDEDENNDGQQDSEDLFTTASEEPSGNGPVTEEPAKEEQSKDEDLFAGGGTEISLDDTPQEEVKPEPVSQEPAKTEQKVEDEDDEDSDLFADASPVASTTKTEESAPAAKVDVKSSSVAAKPRSSSGPTAKAKKEIAEEESNDNYSIEITVTEPHKRGEGMSSYMVYKINTKTTIPAFRKPEFSVTRRFSDFLGLHDKLVEKHMHLGRIVPPAPEKSVIGMTKIKMSKEESGSAEFVEKRRASLERYLNRTAAHPVLRMDPDFREFLEQDGELPKATSTSALSGAGVMRLFNKVTDAVGKATFKMDETDQSNRQKWPICSDCNEPMIQKWFEEKQQQVESLDTQLKKLHHSVESLVSHRKDLATTTAVFAKSAAMLANSEEHTALSRAISQLAEVEEKIEQLHQDQADTDFFVLAELLRDYVSLMAAIKEVFQQRVKVYKQWKEAEAMLTRKRETKARLELNHKSDKIPQADTEIREWESKVEKGQEDFEKISEMIRKEMVRFDRKRVRDFKLTIINYLESLMNNQQQLIKYWESFLPEAKAIA